MADTTVKKIDHYLEVINKHIGLNAFINLNDAQARKMAKESDERILNAKRKSNIDGMVIAIKDNIHVAGIPNTAGTVALKDFIPNENAPIVEKLLSAGAVCFGKANMHELAFGITSYNHAYYNENIGVRNAFDHSKIAGGSSGGSAVAVAMGMCDAALGSDTGGSVVIPAALNGIVGFRPSIGRYSSKGITPISHTNDTPGILAKSMKDVQLIDSFIANGDSDKGAKALESNCAEEETPANIRLGYDESRCLVGCSAEMVACWNMIFEKLQKRKKITLVKIDMEQVWELHVQTWTEILAYEAQHDLVDYLEEYKTGITFEELVSQIASPDVKAIYNMFVSGDKLEMPSGEVANKTTVYNNAMEKGRPKVIEAYQSLFATYKLDCIVYPTTPLPAVDATAESVFPEHVVVNTAADLFQKALLSKYTRNTILAPSVGCPSISIPILPNDALPLGFMLDGNIGDDAHLLSIAELIESVMAEE